MRVTVERIDTHLVAVAPSLSAMQVEVGIDPRMVVIRCPRCRQPTAQVSRVRSGGALIPETLTIAARSTWGIGNNTPAIRSEERDDDFGAITYERQPRASHA